MLTIDQIRLANLNLLVREAGTLQAVAEAAETSSVYLSQVRNRLADPKTGRHRAMGSKLARRLESAFGKPEGWMDEANAQASQGNPAGIVLADVLRHGSQADRVRVLDGIRVQLVHARAHYSPNEFAHYLDALDELEGRGR